MDMAVKTQTSSHRSRTRIIIALIVAVLSDLLSAMTEWFPPLQWGIDLATALILFVILGWHWIFLPALVAEAIPGLAMFPTWLMVVAVYAAKTNGVIAKVDPKP